MRKMKISSKFFGTALFLTFSFLIFVPALAEAKPDLEIIILKGANVAEETPTGMPIVIKIANKGSTPSSSPFKISAEHTGPDGHYPIQIAKDKEDNSWYVWYEKPIPATTQLVIVPAYLKYTKPLKGYHEFSIKIDSCLGDKSLPSYCRVDESNENNNEKFFSNNIVWRLNLPNKGMGVPPLHGKRITPQERIIKLQIRPPR